SALVLVPRARRDAFGPSRRHVERAEWQSADGARPRRNNDRRTAIDGGPPAIPPRRRAGRFAAIAAIAGRRVDDGTPRVLFHPRRASPGGVLLRNPNDHPQPAPSPLSRRVAWRRARDGVRDDRGRVRHRARGDAEVDRTGGTTEPDLLRRRRTADGGN